MGLVRPISVLFLIPCFLKLDNWLLMASDKQKMAANWCEWHNTHVYRSYLYIKYQFLLFVACWKPSMTFRKWGFAADIACLLDHFADPIQRQKEKKQLTSRLNCSCYYHMAPNFHSREIYNILCDGHFILIFAYNLTIPIAMAFILQILYPSIMRR